MIWGFMVQLGHDMWGETLAENGVSTEGDEYVSEQIARCALA